MLLLYCLLFAAAPCLIRCSSHNGIPAAAPAAANVRKRLPCNKLRHLCAATENEEDIRNKPPATTVVVDVDVAATAAVLAAAPVTPTEATKPRAQWLLLLLLVRLLLK